MTYQALIDPKKRQREIRRHEGYMGWTDKEISTLASMWPKASVAQIATRLNRSCSATAQKVKGLRKKGLLEAKKAPRSRSIKPDPQDFDEVKRDYCRKHHLPSPNSVQGLKATTSWRRSCIGWRRRPSKRD